MLDHEVAPQAVTLARHKVRRVVLVLLAITLVVSPVIWYGVHRALLRSTAEAELDALRVPEGWVPGPLGDRYVGPMLGRTKYASITRAYRDLPDTARSVVDTGAQVAAQAGWAADNSYDADARTPTCRPYYDGCWRKDGYRLFLDVSWHDAGTSLKLTISYVP